MFTKSMRSTKDNINLHEFGISTQLFRTKTVVLDRSLLEQHHFSQRILEAGLLMQEPIELCPGTGYQ